MPLFGKKNKPTNQLSEEPSHYTPAHSSQNQIHTNQVTDPGHHYEVGSNVNNGPGATYRSGQGNGSYRMPEAGSNVGQPFSGLTTAGAAAGHNMDHDQSTVMPGNSAGSDSYKARSIEKEREAESLKAQSNQLAEAERLEREAVKLRQKISVAEKREDNYGGYTGFTSHNPNHDYGPYYT